MHFTPYNTSQYKKQKYIYGLGEWISTVFKIFGLFLFYAMKESELQNYPIGS